MRARLYTNGRELGVVELADKATTADVVQAMREHRLYVDRLDNAAGASSEPAAGAGAQGDPADPVAADQPPAAVAPPAATQPPRPHGRGRGGA